MNGLLIVILAALSMLGALSIDAYLPALPEIARQFSVDAAAAQQSLTVYLLAFALMTLFYGTLSDAFGRRPIILIALIFYLFSTLGAAWAGSLEALILFRLLQGLSAGAGPVIGRALVADLFKGAEAQRAMSYISMVFGMAPALAPILGGWLLAHFGWRSIFLSIAAFALLLFTACAIKLPEGLPVEKRQAFHPWTILRSYWAVGSHAGFMLRALSAALAFSGIMIYVAGAPAFVMDILHLSVTEFGWLFVPLICGMTLGSFAAARASHRLPRRVIIRISFAVMILSALAGLAYAVCFEARIPWSVIPPTVYAFGGAFSSPVMAITLLEMFPKVRGLASSLHSFFFMLLFAIESGAIIPLLYGSAVKFALAGLIGAILSLACWALASRFPPQPAPAEAT